jgi:hypothetical protein
MRQPTSAQALVTFSTRRRCWPSLRVHTGHAPALHIAKSSVQPHHFAPVDLCCLKNIELPEPDRIGSEAHKLAGQYMRQQTKLSYKTTESSCTACTPATTTRSSTSAKTERACTIVQQFVLVVMMARSDFLDRRGRWDCTVRFELFDSVDQGPVRIHRQVHYLGRTA